MADGRDGVFLKNRIEGGTVPQVSLIERRPIPCDGCHTLKNSGLAVGEIVHDNRIISRSAEGNNGVAPNVAGSAGHKDNFFLCGGNGLHFIYQLIPS